MRPTVSCASGIVLTLVGVLACSDSVEPNVPLDSPAEAGTAAELSPVVTSVPLAITNLSVASGKSYTVVPNGFVAGALQYIDRTHRIGSPIAAGLDQATYIRTAENDRQHSLGSSSFLSFDVNQDVVVYVAHDDAIARPNWLTAGFTDSNLDLVRDAKRYSLFRRAVPKGRVTLGSNTQVATTKNMYTVVVQPAASPTPPPPPPPPSNCTGSATVICPGESIQAKVNAASGGAIFTLKPGVHRLQQVTPKSGQTFQGEPGAILSGAQVLTGWAQDGSRWYVTGQTQGTGAGDVTRCKPTSPRCDVAEQLWINGTRKAPVTSLAAVTPGSWFFDYGADRIYVGDNPAGQTVETSVTPYAFGGAAANVTIAGLVIEKYAARAQSGAIGTTGAGADWIVRDNEVRDNHGIGIRVGLRMQALRNKVLRNGQLGIAGIGNGALVAQNEIAFNNSAGYNPYWEAGGTKFTVSTDLTMRGNFAHHNAGFGLGTDINNVNTLYEDNRVEDNDNAGIFHEISYKAVIRNNICRRNGRNLPSQPWADGAGILIGTSRDVEVYGNTVEDNYNGITASHTSRGSGSQGVYEVRNLWVHDNTIRSLRGFTGVVQNVGSTAVFSSLNNRFDRNKYTLAAGTYFEWMNGGRTWGAWRGYGQDVNGTLTP